MNLDEKNSFEDQLRQFKPSKASPQIELQISRGLEKSNRVERRRKFASILTWGSVAMAASILITFGFLLFNGRLTLSPGEPVPTGAEPIALQAEPPAPEETLDTFQPVLAENNLQSRVDEGIVFLRNGLTARRYRYEFLDRVVWKNPSNGAVVEMEIPRDEVILVPVQTY
ncbi:hypothetical protein G0Q06_01650 [Puniceicoccales bacterium CK1056]|uniref:Uncharacterized protein n=1 Tax=Oceanipulchritudo coccoides TaxID=2706888 RepID=A0A6B2LX54_9BACT|nr:hypothetical protein [Oceanipulchritudo coccoides]NDV61148.1 hypothetical protein [Oceanipulchritudo coccoides]